MSVPAASGSLAGVSRRSASRRQQAPAFFLVGGDFGQRHFDVVALLLQRLAVVRQHAAGSGSICAAVSLGDSYMSTMLLISDSVRPRRLPRRVSFRRVRSRGV